MQDVSSDYLGKFSFNDPRSQITPVITNSAEESLKIFAPQSTPLNQWAILKFKFFPKGYSLFVILIVFALWFTANLKRAGIFRDLALVGLLSTIASLTDMTIAIFGDGKHEIVKHLFLSNVLFDIALIAFINSILLFYFEFPRKASQKRNRNISG